MMQTGRLFDDRLTIADGEEAMSPTLRHPTETTTNLERPDKLTYTDGFR